MRPPWAKLLHIEPGAGHRIEVRQCGQRREMRFDGGNLQGAVDLRDPDRLLVPYVRRLVLGLALVPAPRHVLHVGLGVGALVRHFLRVCPLATQTVFERDPAVVAMARRWFALPEHERLSVQVGDAAELLRGRSEEYDLIVLDAYGPHGPPASVVSQQFLQVVLAALTANGWAIANIWRRGGWCRSYRAYWQGAFADTAELAAGWWRNRLLVGRQQGPPADREEQRTRARELQRQTGLPIPRWLARLRPLRSVKDAAAG